MRFLLPQLSINFFSAYAFRICHLIESRLKSILESLGEFCSVGALVGALEQSQQPPPRAPRSIPSTSTPTTGAHPLSTNATSSTSTWTASTSTGVSSLTAASPLMLSALGEQLRAELVALASDDAELLLADESEAAPSIELSSHGSSMVHLTSCIWILLLRI